MGDYNTNAEIKAVFDDIRRRLNTLELPLKEWQTPSLQNSFEDYASLRFIKDKEGFVHLRGETRNVTIAAAAGTTIFTLPAGCRPAVRIYWPVSDSFNATLRHMMIDTSGNVKVSDSHGAWPNPAYVNVGGISFRAEA